MIFQNFSRGFTLFLLCLANLTSAQKENYNGIKFIKPSKCSIEAKATQIEPSDFKHEMTEFGQVIFSDNYIDDKSVRKCGFISKTGGFILPKIFNSINIWDKTPNLAFVKLNPTYSIYDIQRQKWLRSFDQISIPAQDLNYFIVSKNEDYFLLDKECNEVLHKSGYELTTLVTNDLIIVKNKMTKLYGVFSLEKKKFIIDDKFTLINKPDKFDAFIVSNHKLKLLYDFIGNQMTKEKYLEYSHLHNTDICALQTLNNEIIILNSNGKVIDSKLQDSLFKTAFKSFKGQNIEGKKYYSEKRFSTEGKKQFYIAMNSNGKYGILNSHKKDIVPFEYDYIEARSNIVILNKDEQFELLDITKDTIQSNRKLNNERIFESVCGLFMTNGELYEPIGRKLMLPDPIKYMKRILHDNSLKESYIVQDKTGKWSMYSPNNKITTVKYDKITSYSEAQANDFQPLMYVNYCANGLWGLCDLKGNEIIKPMFEEIIRTDFDYLVVKSKNKHGIYNVKTKQYIFEPTYDFIMFVSPYKYYAEKDGEQLYLTF